MKKEEKDDLNEKEESTKVDKKSTKKETKKESKKDTKKDTKKESKKVDSSKAQKEPKEKKTKKVKAEKKEKKDKESAANKFFDKLPISDKAKNVILGIIVVLLAIFLIYGLIDSIEYFKGEKLFNFDSLSFKINNNNDNKDTNNKKANDVKYKGIDKNGKYYLNPIDIKYPKIEKANPYSGVDYAKFPYINQGIEYVQIDGLKNQEVEDKINKDIKEQIEKFTNDCLKEVKEEEKQDIYQEITILSNFNNVLSMVDEMGYSKERTLYLNYDLNTGNKIEPEDIFQFDDMAKELKEIVRTDIVSYEEHMKEAHSDDPHFKPLTDEEINKIIDTMYNEFTSENGKFGFTPSNVFIFSEQGIDSIGFETCIDNTIIYNRFVGSEDIYDGKYKKVGPFYNLTHEISTRSKILEEADNYYINASVSAFRYSQPNVTDAILNDADKKMREDVEEFKKMAAKDKDHFYIYNSAYYMPIVDGDTFGALDQSNQGIVHTITETLKTTKEEYENTIKDNIMDFVYSGYTGEDGAENMIGLIEYEDQEGYSVDLFTTTYDKDGKAIKVDKSNK